MCVHACARACLRARACLLACLLVLACLRVGQVSVAVLLNNFVGAANQIDVRHPVLVCSPACLH